MAKSAQRQKGIAEFEEVMGFTPPEMDDPFFEMTLDHLFPNVWGRGELSRRERRLITLRSVRHNNSAKIAPTPADGRVERIVSGWM